MREFFKSHLLMIVLVPLGILFVGSSYVRFIILEDYFVSYEVDCEPSTQSCFIGCEDDDCNTVYPYYVVEKYAHDLQGMCGTSVIDCAAASTCLPTDSSCTITMCDTAVDDCFENETHDTLESEVNYLDS